MRTFIAAALLLLFTILSVQAQQLMTVGEILDKGGKKLSKADAQQIYAGATVSGVQGGTHPDTTFKNTYLPDGHVTGDAWNKGVWFTKITGTWTTNDLGQVCQNLKNEQNEAIIGCQFYFSLNGKYYAARAEERATLANERSFTR